MKIRTISHFRILEQIGSGGMGVVYKALDLRLERTVAVKLLPPGLADDEERRKLLQHEAQLAAQLDHPHICGIYEMDRTEDGGLFVAMPYYPGESLAARLTRGELSVEEALVLGIQVAEALAAAHDHGIIHRDVKPSNILLAAGGGAKLLDFGLAVGGFADPTTPAGIGPGTLRYMSPEQVRGVKVDRRTDLWSLGATLYEAVSGRPCFAAARPAETLEQILNLEPPPLRTLRPDVAPALSAMVERCLAKDREARYPGAGELLADLRGARDAGHAPTRLGQAVEPPRAPTEAAPPSLPAAEATPEGRSRRHLYAALAAVVLVAAALLLLRPWTPAVESDDGDSLVVLPFANLTGDPALDYLGEGLASGLVNRLSEVEGLQLIGRSMAASYRDHSPAEAGRLLGASRLLEGNVQIDDQVLRVAAHLTDARDGTVLWTETFEGTPDGIFGLQYRLAEGVTDALKLPLSGAERNRLRHSPTPSQRAYRSYLQGRHTLDSSPEDDAAMLAERQLRNAIQLDPRFALAHAALSEALWRRFRLEGEPELAEQSHREAQQAREIDPALPEARVALARAERAAGRTEDSIAGIQAVLADHPHPAEALRELAISYQTMGDMDAAERCFRDAVNLEPDDWMGWNALGSFLVHAANYRGAETAYRKAAQLAPPSVTWPQQNETAMLLYRGEYQAAVEAFEQIRGTAADPVLLSNMATAFFFLGRLQRAEELYRRAVALEPDDPELHRNLGDLYQRQGRRSEAVASYRRALSLVETALDAEHHAADLPLDRAVLEAKVGACDRALESGEALWATMPHTAETSHALAQAWALCGDSEAALDALAQAVDAGYPSNVIAQEDEFHSLADLPRFRALTSGPRE